MKKLALALCLLAVSFTAQAQFEKGTTIINPSLSGLDFSYSKTIKQNLELVHRSVHFCRGYCLDGKCWSRLVETSR